MRILVLQRGDPGRKADLRFRHVPPGFEAELVGLDAWEQQHLESVLPRHEPNGYDRVVLDLKWAFIRSQAGTIRSIPNLVIHEQDTWVNYYPYSPDYGRFEQFYYRLPRFRLICTSFGCAARFRARGLDARCVPKSYDPGTLRNLEGPRPVPYGFIGTRNSRIYYGRNRMLGHFREAIALEITRTSSRAEYLQQLNRIRIFVSADVGMGEYMAKNFEAMGCGCMLLAYRQGGEEVQLGLEDMRNVVLYSSLKEALDKLRHLEEKPAEVERIAANGQRLAETRYTAQERDRRLYEALRDPVAPNRRVKKRPYALQWLRSIPARLRARAEEGLRGSFTWRSRGGPASAAGACAGARLGT